MNSDRLRKQTERILLRDGNLCHYCSKVMLPRDTGDQMAISREHVVPRMYNGPNDDDNIILAHRICNNKRGTKINYCGCSFCINATEKYWYRRYFPVMMSSGKPRVTKKYGKWFIEIGNLHPIARNTFEEAHCMLYLKSYEIRK